MVFSGDFPGNVSLTSHDKGVPGAPFQGIQGYDGHPPVLNFKVVVSKVVFSGPLSFMEWT